MEESQKKKTLSRSQANMLLLAAGGLGAVPALLSTASSHTIYMDVFTMFAVYLIGLGAGGTFLTRRYEGKEQQLIEERDRKLKSIADTYNKKVDTLVELYNEDVDNNNGVGTSLESLRERVLGGNSRPNKLTTRQLKKAYSSRYENCSRQFAAARHSYLNSFKQEHGRELVFKHLWGWLFFIGIAVSMICFLYSAGAGEPGTTATPLASKQEVTYWNAQNIPIPYLQDSTQYVSNPDHVLSDDAVNRINSTMKRIEHETNVQTVVIVVNHIENDDPYRMAQDVGNNYGVGYNDRGLVVVVGYEDHSINMSPGRSLEADLTDAECKELQQRYVIPAMRAEQPDSAMIYLSDAILAKLQSKELPQMASLRSSADEEEDKMAQAMGLYTCLMLCWIIFFVYKNKKYRWLGAAAAAHLVSNPFYVPESSGGGFFVSGGGGGGGFHGGGGGGFGGGSFGGGSFGGGGATSRW
jgi:uncharacterized membrane protein YgcG